MKNSILAFILAGLTSLFLTNSANATITFSNHTNKPLWLTWQALGCVWLKSYGRFSEGFVCQAQQVLAGQTIEYDFPWGTSFSIVKIYGSKDSTENGVWFYQKKRVHGDESIDIPAGWGPKSENDPDFQYQNRWNLPPVQTPF